MAARTERFSARTSPSFKAWAEAEQARRGITWRELMDALAFDYITRNPRAESWPLDPKES